jgi:hypothetical protein
MFLDAGLIIEEVTIVSRPAGRLVSWAEHQGRAPGVIEKLQEMLAQAPAGAVELSISVLHRHNRCHVRSTFHLHHGKKVVTPLFVYASDVEL